MSKNVKLRPLSDQILVKRQEAEEKTPGGILLPDVAKQRPQLAEVLAVGPGKMKDDGSLIAMQVKPGDVVLFGKYGGSDFEIGGEKHLILKESEILAVVEP